MGKTDYAKIITQVSMSGNTTVEKALLKMGNAARTAKAGVDSFNQTLFFAKNTFNMLANTEKAIKALFNGPIIEADNWREALQFIGLSADEAKKKIEELLQTSIDLDQRHKPTVEAYASLKKFGGDELASPKNMALVSQSAKYTNTDFNQMADNFGRFHNKLKEGREFAMAGKFLRELGLISGETMKEIDALAESYSLDALKDKIDALREKYDTLQPSQRIGIADEINTLTAKYEDMKVNPQTVDVFAAVWQKTMDEVAATVSKVDLADQTFQDMAGHNEDLRNFSMMKIGMPAFMNDFRRRQRETVAMGEALKLGMMDRYADQVQDMPEVKAILAGAYSKTGQFMDDPQEFLLRRYLPSVVMREIDFGKDQPRSFIERMLAEKMGSGGSKLTTLLPSIPEILRAQGVGQQQGPTYDGMFGVRLGELNEQFGQMVDRAEKITSALENTLNVLRDNQGRF